jgi:transposase-like protein
MSDYERGYAAARNDAEVEKMLAEVQRLARKGKPTRQIAKTLGINHDRVIASLHRTAR